MNFKPRDLWEYLASTTDKKIVMYGMGNGADKIIAVCERYGIEIADFFASDGFVRGHFFHGKRVLSYTETKEKYGKENIIVLLSFASALPDVLDLIKTVGDECELYAPDVPVTGNELFNFEFYEANKEKISATRELFADDESRRIYDNVISYKLTGDVKYLFDSENEKDDVYQNILGAKDFVRTVDAGAYNGDTARELAEYSPNLKEIVALEPDRRNFRKLSEYAAGETRFSLSLHNNAAWDKEEVLVFDASGNRNAGVNPAAKKTVEVMGISIDSIANGPVDYIKYDVEGAEREALLGSRETIEKYRPALLVSLYHRSGDIFELPHMIHEMAPDYKLYLRRYPYIPAWDLNLLAVKENL